MGDTNLKKFIEQLPKAELHIHIEGALEPEQLLFFAERNKIKVPYSTPEEVKASRQFNSLETFLASYYTGQLVLVTEQDFYDLTLSYLKKVSHEGVLHTEIFFETQSYKRRGIKFGTIISGVYEALREGEKKFGITSGALLCFLRDLPEADAFEELKKSLEFRNKIIGVGLASQEAGNPPSKFTRVFKEAKSHGYHRVAHAGEEGGPRYIREALEFLQVERIDHGVHCLEDRQLTQELVKKQIPLTVCPLSNAQLSVYKSLSEHPIKKMLEIGLLVSINSDDPAYFGAYINDNYLVLADKLGFSKTDLVQCARNSFISAFISQEQKNYYLKQLDNYQESST